MKTSFRHTLTILVTTAVLPAAGLLAQSPAPTSTPSVSVPAADNNSTTADTTAPAAHGRHGGRMRERLAVLTPDERKQLKAAHRKAKEDPAVKAAEATRETDRKSYHRTMKEALLRADPSVAPILEKLRENRPGRKNA